MKRYPLWIATIAAVFTIALAAHAQPMMITPELALARTFVREAGIRAWLRDDGPAIHAVIVFRSEHIYRSTYMEGIRRFTHGAPVSLTHTRPWITQLFPSGAEPSLYPSHLRWSGRGDRHWARTYRQAAETYRGNIGHRCGLTPHTWGNFYDAQRYRAHNPEATELDCGQTCTLDPDGEVDLDSRGNPKCNFFFHLPRYGDRFPLPPSPSNPYP